ncbi:MAG: cytochrome-c peroxidase [Gaiellaceae bacterium]|jgi:cytochrome c peroxidase
MNIRRAGLAGATLLAMGAAAFSLPPPASGAPSKTLDARLTAKLHSAGFNGRIESSLEPRLGRQLDQRLANIGRFLWFDTITGLNNDNTCAGCHSPTNGFGDSQPIAIGIDNNGIVGPDRTGPRNMRHTPMVINTAFFPRLMWNSRFASLSVDPFDNTGGFQFPAPEGTSLSGEPHLLDAQAFIPPTERNEVAGFTFHGNNDDIRAAVIRRLNETDAYRRLFGEVFEPVRQGAPIDYDMFARAISEFEFTLTFANAPVDAYARGNNGAMTRSQKRGALLFFGKAGCVACHAVSGTSNQMFSDFREHAIGVPQLVPKRTNAEFDGEPENRDFGREEVTLRTADRYAFRTPSLRNVAVEAAYMHDGAFTNLAAAIRHHLDPAASLLAYNPAVQGLPVDLSSPISPTLPLLLQLDPRMKSPRSLTRTEFRDLLAFVRGGLLDPRAEPSYLRQLVPESLPSGRAPLRFEFPASPSARH